MRKILKSFFIVVLLGFSTIAYAQLPSEVIADKYLVQAEQLLEKKDYVAALNMMDKILALQKEHNITLLDEFHFKYAQVAFSVGSFQTALDAVSKYLSAEQEGEFYEEALVLLIKIEKELAKFEVFGAPRLTNHPECYFWNFSPEIYPPMTWSGECFGGFAQGKGTLLGNSLDDMYFAQGVHSIKKITRKERGQLQNGKKHGHWVESYTDSTKYIGEGHETQWLRVAAGLYVEGKRHGYWVTHLDSLIDEKGPYMDGKRHGDWVHYFPDGSIEAKGSYVNNKRHGDWVHYFPNGSVRIKTSWANGKRSGHWVWYNSNGDIQSSKTY